MRIFRKILITVAVLAIAVPLAFTAVLSSNWFKPKLTEICNSFIVDGQIGMDSLSVSLLEEIPLLSIKLYNGAIHSYVYMNVEQEYEQYLAEIPSKAHTPVSFKEIIVSLNIPKLLFGKIDIRRIRVVSPKIYGYISPWGKANWEIFPTSSEEVETESDSGSSLNLSVKRFSLSDATITLHDGANKSMYSANVSRFFTRGNVSMNMDEMDLRNIMLKGGDFSVNMKKGGNWIKVGIDSLYVRGNKSQEEYKIILASRTNAALGGKAYTHDFPLDIRGTIGMDITNPVNFTVDSTIVSIAGSPIIFDGKIGFMGDNIFTNMECSIPGFKVGKAISYLDTAAFPVFKGMSTNLKVALELSAQGRYETETGLLPAITADIKIPEGNFMYPGIDMIVHKLGFDGNLTYDPYIADSTSIVIRNMDLDATGMHLEGHGKGIQLLGDPQFDLQFEGGADLTKLSSIFLKDAGITAKGDIAIDLKGKFKGSDLSIAKIGNTKAFGRFKTDNLLVDIPQDTIYADLRGVTLLLGSLENKRDTTIAIGEKTLQASFRADSAHVLYKKVAEVELSKTRASVKSAADGFSGDTSRVHPLKGSFTTNRLKLEMADSIRLRGSKIALSGGVYPSMGDSLAPELNLSTSAGRLAYRDAENYISIRNAEIGFGGTLRSANRKMRKNSQAIAARRDSLMAAWRVRRDNMPKDILGNEGNIDMSVGDDISSLLEKWDANCTIKADGGRIITPYFPLKNSVGTVDLTISTNDIQLRNTQVNLGNTDLNLTGRIWGIRRAITRGGKLHGDLLISSDTLNMNQLMLGLEGYSAYTESGDSIKNTIAKLDNEEEIAQAVTQMTDTTEATSSLLLIPGNIDLKIGLLVGYGEFSNIALNGVTGNLYARNRVLQIENLKAVTEAGDIALTALYSTKSKEDLSTGFDLELRNVQVDRLIDIVPSVDTLVPMLRSFEGILDCEVAATAKLDTNMNILLPTLNGAARIQGDNLVLLDEETFAKVAKLLRFKNKENNEIEHISIEMLVKDNKVEMFPFVVQMDRVVAAASGEHNLDMSFKYHLSVIKSPLPMRLGINVSGTFDDMKFRLGKPLYKDANVPSYTQVIDESRINLRNSLNDIFKKGSHDITRLEVVKRNEKINQALQIKESEELSEEEKKALEKEGFSIPSPRVP